MTKRILIIGGYGNFGSYIAKRLATNDNIKLIIAGRSFEKASALSKQLASVNSAEPAALDITQDLEPAFKTLAPDMVIHTSGPYQGQSYKVAEACIEVGCHYVDLADAREFVSGINILNADAEKAGACIIAGASSVPCLSASLIDHYLPEFSQLTHAEYAITTTQHNNRGVGTTAAILSYVGKPFTALVGGVQRKIFGWQGLKRHRFNSLGVRYLANINVPDLELLPSRYPTLQTLRVYAGLEIPLIHVGLWGLSWLVRADVVRSLRPWAPHLLKASFWFDRYGSDKSGFHMKLDGEDQDGTPKTITFDLIAGSGHGPFIPCMPAILLAEKLAAEEPFPAGAMPCIGMITRDEYLDALSPLDISWQVKTA